MKRFSFLVILFTLLQAYTWAEESKVLSLKKVTDNVYSIVGPITNRTK